MNQLLSDKIRPKILADFYGQEKLIRPGSYLHDSISKDCLSSMIFWGPPGSGKTTLAHIIANQTKADFKKISAVSSGKKELFKIIESARSNASKKKKTILFIDEIHRWNKAQQDALLPFVEDGTLILIGATTENPSFEINSALLSRSRIIVLERLSPKDLEKILERGLNILKKQSDLKISPESTKLLSNLCNGDARIALNTLEACSNSKRFIDPELIREVLQKSHLIYDKKGDEHYHLISALHKSMRGNDPDASLYWLARMTEGGEDPLFIARRLVRFASEDIGLINNSALLLANSVFDSCHKLGYPECSVHLAQCVIYLAQSKKDTTAYQAYNKAKSDVWKFGNLPVPLHLRNAPTKMMSELGFGRDYQYTPLEDSSNQKYFPDSLEERSYLKECGRKK